MGNETEFQDAEKLRDQSNGSTTAHLFLHTHTHTHTHAHAHAHMHIPLIVC